MKYLLDTHVLLWWLDENSPLSTAVRHNINDGKNQIFVSAASLWELAIKKALGKIKAPNDLLEILQQNNITVLSITAQHAYGAGSLPRLHGDPFDRMLVIQAEIEKLIIITHDKTIQSYPIHCLMV